MGHLIKIIACFALLAVGCVSDEQVVQQPVAPAPPPCTCSGPCTYLVNNPNGVCPCKSPDCKCVPSHKPVVNEYGSAKEVILDGFQPGYVAVQDIRRSRTNDGYQRVQVLVKNLTTVPMRTRYRFDWQDANGVVVMDPDHDAWEKMTLIPGDNGTFTSIAPKKNCVDFRLRMKLIQSEE